ncbi:MAG: hypothetical protein DHS20C05_00340 [Hyphococcus sp.]|nr:MAG: hypothetical protein DHS20C05_00340 [Marinicaulis sp.]
MGNSAPYQFANTLRFRPVRPLADANRLIRYGRDLYVESLGTDAEFCRDYGVYGQRFPMWIAACAARDPALAVFLLKEGAPVGFAAMGVARDRQGLKAPTTGLVHHFYVDPSCRGQGYGGLLDDYARAKLKSAGCSFARLNVTKSNARAIRFYLAQGWRDIGAPSGSILRHMELAL